MSLAIVIRDATGARTLGEQDLPLRIGTGPRASIRLPGPVSDIVHAMVGVLDGRPFIQHAGGQSSGSALPVAVNGEPLAGTRWLGDGDEISVGAARISCRAQEGTLEFAVRFSGVDYATLPPEPEPVGEVARKSPASLPRRAAGAPAASRWRLPAIYGVSLLLAFCAFWLVTSSAVRIATDPAAASVDVRGTLDLRIGGRYLLRPGKYSVTATAPGYAPATAEFTVGGDASEDVFLHLERLPGRLRVATLPATTAEVFVDGSLAGRIPVAGLELAAGVHKVRIVAPRYQPWEEALKVEGGGVQQSLEARLVPGWAEVSVNTVPPGAAILADGAPLGTTPATIQLMAGNRTLVLEKDGFKTLTRLLTVVANEPQTLADVALVPADGLVRVSSEPVGATVTVAGRYRGVTPVEIELPPGQVYTLSLAKPGYETVQKSVDLSVTRGASVRAELVARFGIVRVRSEPPDAEVLVDGKRVDAVPVEGQAAVRELSLPAVRHRLEVRKAGLAPFVTEVTPEPGLPRLVEVKLLSPAEAVAAAVPRIVKASQGIELRLVQPGTLRMGAPRREQGRRANETEREVRLTRRYYLGVREITNTQFRAYRPNHTSGAEKYQQLAAGEHPVVMLAWDDAAAFCNWLSDQDQLPHAYRVDGARYVPVAPANTGYRLPTEAEWEWAARYNGGAGQQRYPWGDAMPPTRGAGNFADESAKGFVANVIPGYDDGYPVTAPVGTFQASRLGFYDLGGNAAEWVGDRYSVGTSGGPVEVDPTGPGDGQYHVIRGSSWRSGTISELRFAYRDFGDVGRLDVGFRIARYADDAGN